MASDLCICHGCGSCCAKVIFHTKGIRASEVSILVYAYSHTLVFENHAGTRRITLTLKCRIYSPAIIFHPSVARNAREASQIRLACCLCDGFCTGWPFCSRNVSRDTVRAVKMRSPQGGIADSQSTVGVCGVMGHNCTEKDGGEYYYLPDCSLSHNSPLNWLFANRVILSKITVVLPELSKICHFLTIRRQLVVFFPQFQFRLSSQFPPQVELESGIFADTFGFLPSQKRFWRDRPLI